MFIVNLALSDLAMMTTQGLAVSVNAFMQDYWMYSALGCKIYACLGGIFGKYFLHSDKDLLFLDFFSRLCVLIFTFHLLIF